MDKKAKRPGFLPLLTFGLAVVGILLVLPGVSATTDNRVNDDAINAFKIE